MKSVVLTSWLMTIGIALTARSEETLSLKQEREGGPAINLSGQELAELGDPFFNLVLKNNADVVSLSQIEDLIQPEVSRRRLFVVDEHIMDSSPGSRRSVLAFQGSHRGEILDTNLMLSVFFSASGYPESPQSPGADRLRSLEAWGWDNHRGRYNYYKLDQSGTPDLRMTWKFRGSSAGADLLTSFDRRNTCVECHINGGPIMKELFLPWSNWHSFKSLAAYLEQTAPSDQRWPVADRARFQRLVSAERLEIPIIAAIRQFNTRRINSTLKREDATGDVEVGDDSNQTVMEGKRLLKPLFETTEFNIISAAQLFGAHPFGARTGGGENIAIPPSFFLNSNLIGGGGPGGYKGLGISAARTFSADAGAVLDPAEYNEAVEQLGLQILGRTGDANFAWMVPEPSHVDNDMVDQLISRGIVPGQFVAAVLAVDLKNPMLSESRAELLKYVPERFTFVPIEDGEGTDFTLFREHDLTTQVIASIEADSPDPGSTAHEFLEVLKATDQTVAPIRVLERRIADYVDEVRTSLSTADAEARGRSVEELLIRADRLRKKVVAHDVMGSLDETGGVGLFPLR